VVPQADVPAGELDAAVRVDLDGVEKTLAPLVLDPRVLGLDSVDITTRHHLEAKQPNDKGAHAHAHAADTGEQVDAYPCMRLRQM
jgi:hypothetical protein